MEYILTEILKNSFRATIEHHRQRQQHHSGDGSDGPVAATAYNVPLSPVLITVVPPPRLPGINKPATLSLRIRDQGGGVAPADMERIFSYAFTTAGRRSSGPARRHGRGSGHDEDAGDGGGPYAAQQHVGRSGAVAAVEPEVGSAGGVDFFGEITSKGIETGLGTIAGLGFGLPMSRLYAQ
jgi:26S proteasome regulatory subunit T1